ncbi:MAG TPA: tetratricopeptide repeat protein, partial [Candidatus Elarobacter sp.]|nr:tetratricopeptide repeat protein [Candidatus Elarobacter sp.]
VRIQNLVDDASGAASTMTHVLARIFPTTPRIRYRNVIHESVVVDGGEHLYSVMSPILVRHKGYTAAMMDARSKNERNKPLLARAIEEASGDAFSWFNFGISAISAADFETGIEALEKMFAMPGSPRAFFPIGYVVLASAYADGRKDVERAIEILDEGLARFPGHPNVLFTRAHLLGMLERYDEARAIYDEVMAGAFDAARHSMVDDEIWTWKSPLNVASTYVKEKRFGEAVPWFERALASKPESALLRGLMAAAYEHVGRYYDAERLFRDGAEHDGQSGFVEYVNYLMRRRRFAEAFERVEQRRDAVADHVYATLLYSAAQTTRDERLGDPEPYALRALALEPGNGHVLRLLDAIYVASGDEAKRAQLRLAELEAPLADAADFARRSHRLIEDGQLEAALTVARDGLVHAPGNGVLSFNAGLAAARLRRDDEAMAHLEGVDDADAHATAARALRAEILRRSGDLDGALAELRRMCGLPMRDEEALRHATVGLATALLEAGRLDDAGELAALVLG